MSRPRLFLVPGWTEVEWTIRPLLEEWAEVGSFDPAGDEVSDPVDRAAIVDRGLEVLDGLGWDEYVIVGDTFGTATAVRIAQARPDRVRGLALGHGCLSWEMDGERPPINRELWSAMTELLKKDYASFARSGLAQLSQGSFDEEVGERMLERISVSKMRAVWELIPEHHEPIGELLEGIDSPLLLVQHKGCLMFSDEGFADAVAAFPDARTAQTAKAPSADEEFAAALREFCSELDAESA